MKRRLFNEHLRTVRKRRYSSHVTAAEDMGLSRDALGNYERGDCLPNVTALLLMCKALNVSPNELLMPDGNWVKPYRRRTP
ncbi:helix-turn-helix domain-containing protein [Methyloceanibacter sp.]|uniref:helix-turn-helix domain-containing protein n=1 Tax=Methyloceanibacter sp. TaxID=1965321 RepID=UPI003D6CA86A